MFMPSARNWEEMKYEAAGCWTLPINKGDEFALIAKMAVSSIKAVYRSCLVSLTVARVNTSEGVVLATTLMVADDPNASLMLTSALRHADEYRAIEGILRTGRTLAVFFDELSRPVARATCILSQPKCMEASAMVIAPGNRYVGPWTDLLSEVLDEVQGHSDPQLAVPMKLGPTFITVPLKLSDFETLRTTTVGVGDVLDFRLDDPDEGTGLEQSTWHLLESLFEGQIYHSPKVVEGDADRELTDIMTYCNTGICLFEAKAAAMLTTSLDRHTERRAKSVQKQIDKGIGQLIGALKNLNSGKPLRTKKGASIDVPDRVGISHHCIIMVSELLPSLNWEAIGIQLLSASQQSGRMFHVLDLRELRILVGISQDDPVRFVTYLAHRFDVMTERKHAMLRTKLDGPALP